MNSLPDTPPPHNIDDFTDQTEKRNLYACVNYILSSMIFRTTTQIRSLKEYYNSHEGNLLSVLFPLQKKVQFQRQPAAAARRRDKSNSCLKKRSPTVITRIEQPKPVGKRATDDDGGAQSFDGWRLHLQMRYAGPLRVSR